MSVKEMRDLDVYLAERVMGATRNTPKPYRKGVHVIEFWESGLDCPVDSWEPTTDPADAMRVWDKIAQATDSTPSFTLFEGSWFFTDHNGVNHTGIPTLCLAICLAAKGLFSK